MNKLRMILGCVLLMISFSSVWAECNCKSKNKELHAQNQVEPSQVALDEEDDIENI